MCVGTRMPAMLGSGSGVQITSCGRRSQTTAAGSTQQPPGSPRHRGLTGMRERAQQAGRRLEIDSAPGVGTTVRLEAILPNDSSGSS